MRHPIGLYLTEFASAERPVASVGLPCFDVTDAPPIEMAPFFDADEPVVEEVAAEPIPEAASLDDAPSLDPVPPEFDAATLVETLQAEHAAALAEARRRWVEEEGAALAAGLTTALGELETRLADTVAPLLEPFLVQAAQVTALARLRDALGTLLRDREGTVAVDGPADLLDVLRDAFADREGLTFTVADTPDVTVTLADTRIRSHLAGWARTLETALIGSAA